MAAIIISAFPGTGKTYATKELNARNIRTHDSDSSEFSWISPDVRNPDFPNNYINHIKENRDNYDVIFVSTHVIVRKALVKENIPFITIVPCRANNPNEYKEEYINRFIKRGSSDSFIAAMKINWENFIISCYETRGDSTIIMLGDRYLLDIVEDILKEGSLAKYYQKLFTNMEE